MNYELNKMKERIPFVDYIRVIACFMVMLVHSSENFYAADSSGLAGNVSMLASESNRFWVAFWDGGISRTAVPLFMIISAYGFGDVMATDNPNIRLDVSRIAAQVVSGIGFIGAGTIIFQKNAVRGLTTAAGVWVVAAIGLACGAGMYVLAAVSTLLVLLGLEAFNYFLRRIDARRKKE
jgi:hypothetical protein